MQLYVVDPNPHCQTAKVAVDCKSLIFFTLITIVLALFFRLTHPMVKPLQNFLLHVTSDGCDAN